MKRNILVLLAIFCFIFSINSSLSISSIERHSPELKSSDSPENNIISQQYENPPSVPDRILVKYKKQANRRMQAVIRASLEASYGMRKIRYFPFIDVHVYEATWYKEMTLRGLNRNQNVEYAEEDFLVSIDSTSPNDPSFSNLWGLHNTGQTGGTTDADIDAPEAWDLSTGSSNVIVAVIDTGVDYNHPDLNANMWTNPGETPGNGIDDDGNGYVDDYYGINARYNALDPGDPMDDHSHGTHCSGTIAAVGNNGTGVVGVCWTARIMALKFLGSSGSGSTSDAVECVEYAIDKGAHIMSNSWGGGGYSQSLKNAIAAAKNAGILFMAAAGNSGTNNDTSPHYPSSYDDDNIIAVTATDNSDNHLYNYGASSVDVAAPGKSIYSTILSNGYGYKSGTSMATPHVAGLAALIKAYNSGLNWQQIKNRILDNVEQKSSLAGKILTGGRINAYSSLNPGAVSPVISGTIYDPNSQGLSGVTITFSNSGGTATTDSSGNYSQTVTNGWTGTATPSKSGYAFSPSNRSYTNITSSQSGQNYNATATTLTISGVVRNSAGTGIAGVTITFSNSGGTATTDSNGNYSQTVTNGWSGTATPAKVGYTFSPSGRSYANVTSNQTNQDYSVSTSNLTLISPANGSTQTNTAITFQWIAVAGANNYDLYIRNSSGAFFDTWVGDVTSYTVSGFPGGGTQYSWSVYPRSAAGIGDQSAIWTVTSGESSTNPSAPVLLSPANGSTQSGTSITFQWTAVDGANNYDLYIRNSSGIFFDTWVGNVTSYTVGGFPTDGTQYSWSVYPRSNAGIGTQSEIWTLTSSGSGGSSGIKNGDMEDGSGVPDYWWAYDNDLSRRKGWKRGIAHSGRRSLMIKNSKGNNAYWQGETVSYSSSYPTSLTLGGWARATKVKGQGTFAIRFYIEFEDGTSIWYDDGLRFSQGTHGWEQVETTVSFSKGVRKIRPYCILFSARGYVWFDDVYANRQ